mgnify:CR=1 FL=1
MKKNIIVCIALILSVSTYLQARTLSPTFSIRYEDFVNSTAPSAAIGLHLDIDGAVQITGSHNPPEFNGFKISKLYKTFRSTSARHDSRKWCESIWKAI